MNGGSLRHALEELAREVRRPARTRGRIIDLPGRDLAERISSVTLRAGSEGCATITKCTATTWVTGPNRDKGSTGIFAIMRD